MLLSVSVFLAAAATAVTASSSDHDHYTPTRISYDDLVVLGRGTNEETTIDMNSKFWKTLHEVGMISVTDVPNLNKKSMFAKMEDCIHTRKEISPPEFLLDGGTKRVTVATQTVASSAKDLLAGIPEEQASACPEFQKESKEFRNGIQKVVNAFASSLGLYSPKSVLMTDDGVDMNIQGVVEKGNHLEHFHTYYTNDDPESANTIDWHTDQGLMLLFTPGQQDDKVTSGFFIIKDESKVIVDFDEEIDDVVIMLGDGIDQYFNDDALRDEGKDLRAVPHALTLPATSDSSGRPRVWYGRMVLPPSNAIVPASLEMVEQNPNAVVYTFEDMRKGFITGDDVAINLGCSNPVQVAIDVSRRLGIVKDAILSKDDPSKWQQSNTLMIKELRGIRGTKEGKPKTYADCGKGEYEGLELQCWQRCMDFNNTEYKESCASEEGCNEFYNGNPNGITPETCNAVGLTAMCMDDDNHEWINGYHNHDYYLQCGRPDTVIEATFPPTRNPTKAPVVPPPKTLSPTVFHKHTKKSKKYKKANSKSKTA